MGLLSQITTVFTCRDVNIESLTTSESALQGIHKFTIAVRTTPDQVDKLVRQVEKKIDVLKYEAKKNENTHIGHRQPYTKVEITKIAL